jgi:hypothetical protein
MTDTEQTNLGTGIGQGKPVDDCTVGKVKRRIAQICRAVIRSTR